MGVFSSGIKGAAGAAAVGAIAVAAGVPTFGVGFFAVLGCAAAGAIVGSSYGGTVEEKNEIKRAANTANRAALQDRIANIRTSDLTKDSTSQIKTSQKAPTSHAARVGNSLLQITGKPAITDTPQSPLSRSPS